MARWAVQHDRPPPALGPSALQPGTGGETVASSHSPAFAETVTPRSFFVFNLEGFRAYKQDFDIPSALD